MPGYAEDRAEIEELMACYLSALDWGDGDAYAACFTEDGEIYWARETTRGRAALKAMCLGFREHMHTIMGDVPPPQDLQRIPAGTWRGRAQPGARGGDGAVKAFSYTGKVGHPSFNGRNRPVFPFQNPVNFVSFRAAERTA